MIHIEVEVSIAYFNFDLTDAKDQDVDQGVEKRLFLLYSVVIRPNYYSVA